MPGFEWLVGQLYSWVPSKLGEALPPNPFAGGQESGRTLIVCRAPIQGAGFPGVGQTDLGVHPGKLVDGSCNVGYNGLELRSPVYDVLTVIVK